MGRGRAFGGEHGDERMRLLRENGLSLALLALFVIALLGQALAGWRSDTEERRQHGEPAVTLPAYLASGTFLAATFENWESEFLQMGTFVLLTVFLRQKGSPESKKLDEPEPEDEDPAAHGDDPNAPWPVRKGGIVLRLYAHSLSIAMLLLFILSFMLHAAGSAWRASEEAARHGDPAVGLLENLGNAEFWFESLQNWQSEFLAVAALALLGIYLRERGSPESKPVAAPHGDTGR
jgi:hypothetical protein